ncbi:Ubiquitin-Associated Protein 2 [Manis pentadactyla]|nr:Ubiquitin-Associated Protein 2 [Manis pentadactyla]
MKVLHNLGASDHLLEHIMFLLRIYCIRQDCKVSRPSAILLSWHIPHSSLSGANTRSQQMNAFPVAFGSKLPHIP